MLHERPPDRFELVVRFVFGATFGALGGFFSLAQDTTMDQPGWLTLEILGPALVGGIFAAWFGDRFWLTLADWIWWW